MTNLGKYLIALALVLGAFGTLAFFGVSPFKQEVQQSFGDVVSNTQWFTGGYKVGPVNNALFTSNTITLANGQDQGVWRNTTGVNVIVDTTHLVLLGATTNSEASSTFQFSVGATSTAIIAEPEKFGWITTASSTLAIANFNLATSSMVSNVNANATDLLVADNYWMHASSTPTFINVPPNYYLFVKIDSQCAYAQAGVTCELATSTNRGFVGVKIPFWYHYPSTF